LHKDSISNIIGDVL